MLSARTKAAMLSSGQERQDFTGWSQMPVYSHATYPKPQSCEAFKEKLFWNLLGICHIRGGRTPLCRVGRAFTGSGMRSGGVTASGMPRNVFTARVAPSTLVDTFVIVNHRRGRGSCWPRARARDAMAERRM